MKSAEEVFKEMAEYASDLREFHESCKGFIIGKIREAHADALLHAANLARMGKMNGLRNELDRGHNLALDIMIENLENRIKEIEGANEGEGGESIHMVKPGMAMRGCARLCEARQHQAR